MQAGLDKAGLTAALNEMDPVGNGEVCTHTHTRTPFFPDSLSPLPPTSFCRPPSTRLTSAPLLLSVRSHHPPSIVAPLEASTSPPCLPHGGFPCTPSCLGPPSCAPSAETLLPPTALAQIEFEDFHKWWHYFSPTMPSPTRPPPR